MTYKIKQIGLSLVELMIAMAIGLIVMLVVYQLFAVSEGTRRTSVAGSDAQMSAAIAVSALQDRIRNAGYGVNSPALLGCRVQGWNTIFPPGQTMSFNVTPVVITQGNDNNAAGVGRDSDQITIMYGDVGTSTVQVSLAGDMASPTDDIKLVRRYGIKPGDVFILRENGATVIPAQPGVTVCSLGEVTGTPAGTNAVQHGVADYKLNSGANTKVRFNSSAG